MLQFINTRRETKPLGKIQGMDTLTYLVKDVPLANKIVYGLLIGFSLFFAWFKFWKKCCVDVEVKGRKWYIPIHYLSCDRITLENKWIVQKYRLFPLKLITQYHTEMFFLMTPFFFAKNISVSRRSYMQTGCKNLPRRRVFSSHK